MTITRKAFLIQLVGGGCALALAGCGGGSDDAAAPGGPPPPASRCAAFNFTANHGHVLDIPLADLDSSTAKTYNTRGTATHNHTVTLTPAQLADLKAGRTIFVTTSVDAEHTHNVTGGCV